MTVSLRYLSEFTLRVVRAGGVARLPSSCSIISAAGQVACRKDYRHIYYQGPFNVVGHNVSLYSRKCIN